MLGGAILELASPMPQSLATAWAASARNAPRKNRLRLIPDPDDQHRIAYWIDGYQAAKGEAVVGAVAFDKFGQPVGALVGDCKATPKETLWEKLKKHL